MGPRKGIGESETWVMGTTLWGLRGEMEGDREGVWKVVGTSGLGMWMM